jgi:hypothetical protein
MPRWITRKTLDGLEVAPPMRCHDPESIAAVPGIYTIEECVHILLGKDEAIDDEFDRARIPIRRGNAVVGYLEVTRERPVSR